MALTERRRAALFRGLSEMLDDEEAVGELLSFFPARDADEPASRDFVDARIANVEARISGVEARVMALEARMDARFAEQRESLMAELRDQTRTLTQRTVTTIVAAFGVLVALNLLR